MSLMGRASHWMPAVAAINIGTVGRWPPMSGTWMPRTASCSCTPASAGRAAKMGHRLTIAMNNWVATVRWNAGEPVSAELTVEVDSLEVLRGEGGLKPLSGLEKALARSNALGVLDADRHPQIRFQASDIDKVQDGYRLAGTLEIHGVTGECQIGLRVEDLGEAWRLS